MPFNANRNVNRERGGQPNRGGNQNQGGGGGGGNNRNRNRNRNNRDIPTVEEWLESDPIYKTTEPGITRAWKDYKAGADIARSRSRETFRDAYGYQKNGEFFPGEANIQRERDLRQMAEDYAARGLGTSGMYTGATGQYKDDWERQRDLALQARNWNIQDINQGQREQRTAYQQQLKNLELEAQLRRIQKYGLSAPGA